jgi:hypothetical protein
LPGVDKLLPNLVISPPTIDGEKAETSINNFEISRAKKLAESLADAALIERDAYVKVVEFYNQITPPEPTLEPAP